MMVGGGVVGIIVAIIGAFLGLDVGGGGGGGGGGTTTGGQSSQAGGGIPPEQDPDRELFEFISYVFDDIQDNFRGAMRDAGKSYQDARLVIFTEAVDSGCGTTSSAVGPFYCPPDQQAYVDLSFYRILKEKLGAGGDFAQAYVIAHELGHHLQTLQGIDANVRRQVENDPEKQNSLSVRQELQADCYAGVWASTTTERGLLDRGDIEEAMRAAESIGDDRLQKMSGERVNPETFTHGTSEQRMRWFKKGLDQGKLAACDTFTPTSP